jgi:hypothetical protein
VKKLVRIFPGLVGSGLLLQGTVSVGNVPNVNVANTPSVSVANSSLQVSGNVAVGNALDSSNSPVALLVNQQGQPYQDVCTAQGIGGACTFRMVPNGMRLVIQEFDYGDSGMALQDTLISLFVTTDLGGTSVVHTFPPAQRLNGFGTSRISEVHQATRLYADPGSSPSCGWAEFGSTVVTFQCAISGYLVPAQ